MAKKPTQAEIDKMKARIKNPKTPESVVKVLKKILERVGEDVEDVVEDVEKEEKKVVSKVKKAVKKATKKAPTKSDYEKAKADLKNKTGKSQEECEKIIEQYKELRAKAQTRKTKETATKKQQKKRVEGLKKSDDVIKGTTTKKADKVLEDTAKKVEEKIEKEIEGEIKKEEKEIKKKVEKEVATDTTKTPTQKEAEVKKKVEAEVEEVKKKVTKKVVTEIVIDTKGVIDAISKSLAKFDKDAQKEYLIKLRSDIDKLLAKYMYGGLTDGAVANLNVTQSQMSASSVNPQLYAKGGGTQGYDARQDESLGMRRGKESGYTQSDRARREDSYGKWGERDAEDRGISMETGGKVRTNSKVVREAVRQHILDSVYDENEEEFGNIDDASEYLVSEFKRVADYPNNFNRYPNPQDRFQDYLQGIPFHFEYENYKIEDFLNGLGINSEGKEYSTDQMWGLYSYLIWREIHYKYNRYKKGGKLWIDTGKKGGTKGAGARKGSFRAEADARGIRSKTLAQKVIANPSRYPNISEKSAHMVNNMVAYKKGGRTQGYDARQDESLGMRRGKESGYTQSDRARREDSYGKWGERGAENRSISMKRGGSTKDWIQKVTDNPDFRTGAFTKKANERGLTPKQFMSKVLSNPSRYDERTRRQAQFMKNIGD